MSKIIYGSGNCSLQASNIVALEIRKRGSVIITDKTEDNHHIIANEKKIIIFPVGQVQPLTDLFDYIGELRIVSVKASDADGVKQVITIEKQMHYSEMMNSNAEDITLNSESLSAGYQYKNKIRKTKVDKNIIKNLQSKGNLYLDKELTQVYSGLYHIHLSTNTPMSGADHTEASEDLYMKTRDKKSKRTPRRMTPRGAPSRGTSGGGGY